MKSQKKFIATIFIILGIIMTLSACGDAFTGKIAVKGNEPFTYLVLVTEKGDMKITGPLEKKLRENYQGMRVTVKGTIVKKGGGFMKLPEIEVTEIVGPGN